VENSSKNTNKKKGYYKNRPQILQLDDLKLSETLHQAQRHIRSLEKQVNDIESKIDILQRQKTKLEKERIIVFEEDDENESAATSLEPESHLKMSMEFNLRISRMKVIFQEC